MTLIEALPLLMFAVLGLLLFTGLPVTFVLAGVGLGFAGIGIWLGEFLPIQFNVLPSRIFGSIFENAILTAIPMFIFMGTMLEKSGVARDLLNCLQVLLRRVPGGLALGVTLMGTILAATTGIIGASVIMMTLLALPVMIERKYSHELATGTIAASGTLGILIPPSIMLVIMADLLSRSVGDLFMAAVFPGLLLAGLYIAYILIRCTINPTLAPKMDDDAGPQNLSALLVMVARSFVPPILLISMVLGSILGGLATPTEAAGVGAMGAILLGLFNLVILPTLGVDEVAGLNPNVDDGMGDRAVGGGFIKELHHFYSVLTEVVERAMLTNAMIFGIFIGATFFSYVFRALGGDDIVIELVHSLGLGPWGFLFLIMGLVFVLGFFFDWLEITLIVLPVFAPIIAQLDFGDHVAQIEVTYWFAILLAMNLQTSFLTPPFGFALFYLKAVAPPSVQISEVYRGIIPFVLLQLIGLVLVITYPDIALWLPRVLQD
ncbi:TRAP transporter large permease subunit [Enterovibrio sp. ZSDZ35]|uniref:TRAP transporter large permease subunit n=1 Tax=Enterovibrio qingdaonensis TaxID=2899818 RepID=A0ABT5QHZ1_9GAMM|nr:TRAP transporter large permease subunit [Enterovibrio sp. ZSDZ35]MDD1780592.1 TRAP transporter large permease subunit [Enterovibrio sp. ZSDZ35]